MEVGHQQVILARDGRSFPSDNMDRVHHLFDLQLNNKQAIKLTTVDERARKLNALKKSILLHRKDIETAIYKDLGKPAFETAYSEIFCTLSEIRYVVRNLYAWMKPHKVSNTLPYLGSSSRIMYEPKGNCLLISPWNYPFYLSISHLIVCIAAGNVAILKPSEFTPYTTQLIKQLLKEVFEENEVAVIIAGDEVAKEMTKMPFDHIHFTGSTKVGKMIMKEAAGHMASVTLELGGKSPVIIDEDYNVEHCIRQIGWGKFFNAGQTCIAPDYILIHEKKREQFVTALSKYLSESFGSDPLNSEILSGIVHKGHLKKLKSYLKDAIEKGGRLAYGGSTDEDRIYFAPTIVEINDLESDIMLEEIFGPILPVVTYKILDEALSIVNERPKPLAMYLFSDRKSWINKVLAHTSSGGVSINETIAHFVQSYLPMGGVNHSGIGKSHGHYGFIEFSNQRAILKSHIRGGITWPFQFPYTSLKKKIIDILIKRF